MEELSRGGVKLHKVSMINRQTCTISGVNDVISFDIHEILLETEQGRLAIKGDELHVNRLSLDQGEIDMDGTCSWQLKWWTLRRMVRTGMLVRERAATANGSEWVYSVPKDGAGRGKGGRR